MIIKLKHNDFYGYIRSHNNITKKESKQSFEELNPKRLKNGFYMPFIESAKYLDMKYIGDIHCWLEDKIIPEEVKQNLNKFAQLIS